MARTHLPLRRTAPAGFVAYLIGYLVTFAATIGRTNQLMAIEIPGNNLAATSLTQIFGSTPPQWIVSGWLFYNAHFVPTSLPTADTVNGIVGLTNQSLLRLAGGPILLLYVVPPVFLIGAGYLAVQTATTPGANGERNAGASIVIGYFPLFLVGSFLLTVSAANTPVLASPEAIQAIFLGLVYPIVFGALGGIIAKQRGASEADAHESDFEKQPGKW